MKFNYYDVPLYLRTLRLIFFSSKISHGIPVFITSNILRVTMLNFETVAAIMHDVSTSSTPRNIRELFIHSSDVHTYNTSYSPQRIFMYRNLDCM